MNTKLNSRLLATGLMMTVLAGGLQGQYVSTAVSNGLYQPYDVAANGNSVYISDTANNRIALYVYGSTNTVVSTFAGTYGVSGSNNGTGTSAKFNSPRGIVFARGGVVVVDQGNQDIRFITTNGVTSTLAGIIGTRGYVDGAATNAQFASPADVAVANDGQTLYIADQGNFAVRKIDTNNVVSTIASNYLDGASTVPFHSPVAVAVDTFSNVWVADSYTQEIIVITNGTGTPTAIAGKYRTLGTNDSSSPYGASFGQPSGLVWDYVSTNMMVSDTYSSTIRSIHPTNGGYYVQTITGTAGTRGFVDGNLGVAKLNGPIGLCVDINDSGFYVADTGNNAIRVLQSTQPPAPPIPVPDPVFGLISYSLVNGTLGASFNALPSGIAVFNNVPNIAIQQLDTTVATQLLIGGEGTNLGSALTGATATTYNAADDEQSPLVVQPLTLTGQGFALYPITTLRAISSAKNRANSDQIGTQFELVTGNPNILAQNSQAVTLLDITSNAQIYYTLDGTTPTNGASNTFGPYTPGQIVSFTVTTNTVLTAQAFHAGFIPSGVVTANFSPTNFTADQLTFGFANGEASSKFIGAPGQTFIAPITLTLIPEAEVIDSLQFNIALTNFPGSPIVNTNSLTFGSMLEKPVPGSDPIVYIQIPPAMFSPMGFSNLLLSNLDLLEVGWLERQGQTNLYDSSQQTLITYSQAHDTMFNSSGDRVVVGAYSFSIPTSATLGQTYGIQLGAASATSDGISTPVFIDLVTNGSLAGGTINSTKTVTIGTAGYLVGDTAPFYWFNAGDFGDGMLENNDVTEVFQTAMYGFDGPNGATTKSDYFDAMDSSDGSDNNFYLGNDAQINSIMYGDGVIQVDDVYVTYRRSLDPSLTWYKRSDTSSGKLAVPTNNLVSVPFSGTPASSLATGGQVTTAPRYITVGADVVTAGSSSTVQVPVRVLSADSLPVRVAMLRVQLQPLDGSPAITSAVSFTPSTNLGSPIMATSQSVSDYAAVWLDSSVTGIVSNSVIGTLTVTLPAGTSSNSSYLVHFTNFSASPNGLADFHATIQDGLITVGDRSSSSWGDGISDAWRLVHFGTVYNALSAASADPDGDGASNWSEYIAGTNPNDATSVFQFGTAAPTPGGRGGLALQWQSIVNKHYTIQTTYGLSPAIWKTSATNIIGTGQIMNWTDTNSSAAIQYYRAVVQ